MMNALKQMKLLYVEDDEDTRMALTQLLKRMGAKVFAAGNGEEGLEIFHKVSPDILIVDLILPQISGVEMLRQIRKADQEIKVIVTSTVSMVDTIINVVDLKIAHYMLKPIDVEGLEERLKTLAEEIVQKRGQQLSDTQVELLKNKRLIEADLRKEFFRIIKTCQGRGAKDILVFFQGNTLDITIQDSLTPMEKVLLSQSRNASFVEHFRQNFYHCIENQFTEVLQNVTKTRPSVSLVKVNVWKGVDKLCFVLQ